MSRTRPSRTFLRTGTARVSLAATLVLVAGPLTIDARAATPVAMASAASAVDLGTAASFSVLAGTGVSNTGSASVLALDLGLSPAGVIAGFPPGTARAIHDKDAAAATAQEDRQTAYDAVVAQTGGTPFAGDQAGAVFTPGLYTSAAAVTNTGTITLDANGDPGALFVFQIGAAMSPAAASKVVLSDGALAHNVYWQVNGAVALGAGAKWFGTILTTGAVALGEGASLKGRILTSSTVALANSPVTQPIDDLTAPLVGVDGGAARATNDPTPMVTGTTDEPSGRPVQVTVAGQTLATTVAPGGVWAVSATTLTAGPHDLLATVTDPSGNTGTASQVLTVDLTEPVVTVAGGGSSATKDTTPTISGTADEPGAPTVTVTVAGQTLVTTATGGDWSVTAAALTETAHLVVASVTDAAGNAGAAAQLLDVDITLPVLTIDGGATRSAVDTSPWTYGTTAEKAGTIVHLAIGGQALTATVQAGGTWGVSASALPAGSYLVVASITDAAGNVGSMSQRLTIGPGGDPDPGPGPGPGDPGDPGGPGPVDPGPGDPRHRPDAEIRPLKGTFIGAGTYAAAEQRVTTKLKRRARTATFEVRVTNRGDASERMVVLGTPKSAKFKVVYLSGGKNVTAAVLAGSFRTGALKPGASTMLTVKVTRLKGVKKGKRTFAIRVTSAHDTQKRDTVAAVVKAA